MSDKQYFTVVFEVEYDDEFRELKKEMLASMCSEKLYRGARVTAAGVGDEMTRAEKLLDLLNDENVYVPEKLR